MKLDMVQREMGKEPSTFVPIRYGTGTDTDSLNTYRNLVIAAIILAACSKYFWHGQGKGKGIGKSSSKGSGMGGGMGGMSELMNISKSGATVYGVDKKIRTRFKHVAGLSNAK